MKQIQKRLLRILQYEISEGVSNDSVYGHMCPDLRSFIKPENSIRCWIKHNILYRYLQLYKLL